MGRATPFLFTFSLEAACSCVQFPPVPLKRTLASPIVYNTSACDVRPIPLEDLHLKRDYIPKFRFPLWVCSEAINCFPQNLP